MNRRWAHGLVGLAGFAVVLWALVWAASPVITCRDQVMGPGDLCASATNGRTQSYEERVAAAQQARPVMGAVGLLMVGFATALWVGDQRGS